MFHNIMNMFPLDKLLIKVIFSSLFAHVVCIFVLIDSSRLLEERLLFVEGKCA